VANSMWDSDDDEVLGEPVFEMLVRDGQPVISGSYFMHPPLRQKSVGFDDSVQGRLIVTATNGSKWYADDLPCTGLVTVRLLPLTTDGEQ
jgi:hypothetical protein